MMDITLNLPRPKGEFQIKKWKNGKVVYDSGICSNIVTDNFYAIWFNYPQNYYTYYNGGNQSLMRYCAVSNDNAEVVATDKSLVGQLSTKIMYGDTRPNITTVIIEGKEYYKIDKRYLWNQGDFNNVTISKVGILSDHASGLTNRLIAGQLIKDGLGNPVTITILNDEQLDITYTLYIPKFIDYPTYETGNMIINGIEYPYTLSLFSSYFTTANTTDLGMRTILSTAVNAASNRYSINGNVFTVSTATRTNYDNKTEMVYTIVNSSGSSFSPINTFDIGELYWISGINYINSSNTRFLRYTFTGPNRPIKLTTDTLSMTVKITIQWGED